MDNKLNIFSMNCRGLGDKKKRLDIFNWCKRKKYNIVCLQDTHFDDSMENTVKNEWGFDAVLSTYKSNARGVGIFLCNNFQYELHRSKVDVEGNYVILDITIEGKRVTLVSLYGPNTDKPSFFQTNYRYC